MDKKKENQKPKKLTFAENNKEILESIEPHTFEDRAYGCILGAFIGDSIGSAV